MAKKPGDIVFFNDGTDSKIPALVFEKNADDSLNLVTFPTSSPVERRHSVAEGTGGGTWHE